MGAQTKGWGLRLKVSRFILKVAGFSLGQPALSVQTFTLMRDSMLGFVRYVSVCLLLYQLQTPVRSDRFQSEPVKDLSLICAVVAFVSERDLDESFKET